LIAVIAKGDVARLTKMHGVGKKTAERVVLELKDKVKLLAPVGPRGKSVPKPESPVSADVASALVNLGYKAPQAEAAVESVQQRLGDAPFEALLREALKALRAGA